MATLATPSSSITRALQRSACSVDDHAFIAEIDVLFPDTSGIRGVWLQDVDKLVKQQQPHLHRAFTEAFEDILDGQRLFTYIAPWRLVAALLSAARLLWPDAPRDTSINRIVQHVGHLYPGLLTPMIIAAEGSYKSLFQLIAHGSSLFFNYGSITPSTNSQGHTYVRYDGHNTDIERHFVPGFWEGCRSFFPNAGPVTFEPIHEWCFDIVYRGDLT